MGFGDHNLNLRESSGDFVSQNFYHGVFGVEMTGVDDGHTQILCIPKLVVLHIGSDKGITAGQVCIHQLAAAGTAAYADLVNSLAAVGIPQTLTAQDRLYMGKEGFQRLLLRKTTPKQAIFPTFGIRAGGFYHFYILKTQNLRQGIVDTAGSAVQVGVGVDAGDAVLN